MVRLAPPALTSRCPSPSCGIGRTVAGRLRSPAAGVAALAYLAAAPLAAQARPDSVPPGGRRVGQEDTVALAPLEVRVLGGPSRTGRAAAVTVVGGRELTRGRPGVYLEEALRALPGLQIQNRFNLASGERVIIRGFGARAQFGIRGVKVLVDGIPATLPDGQTALDHVDPAALRQVELLRGPSSTLYGNAAGGVLHLRGLGLSEGSEVAASFAAGSFGLRSAAVQAGGHGGPGELSARVQRFAFDGYRRDPVADDGTPYGGAERTVANLALVRPLARGLLRVTANALDMDARNAGSLNTALLAEGDRAAYRFNVVQKTREVVRQGQLGAFWRGPVGAVDLEVAAWGVRRQLDGPIPPRVLRLRRNAGGVRAVASRRTRARATTLAVAAGAELELQRDDRRNWDNEGGEKGALALDQRERVRSTAAFAQARMDRGPLALSLGLRVDGIRFQAEDHLVRADDPDDSGTRLMSAWSPSAALLWQATDRLEFFASVARSFETPTTTELANRPDGAGGLNPDLGPQTGWNWEGGMRLDAGPARLEGTIFRTELDGTLVPFEVPGTPGRTFFRNAGASHHTGWELSVAGDAGRHVTYRGALTRVDARFDRFTVDGEDYSGNRIPGVAPWRLDTRVSARARGGYLTLRVLVEDDLPVNDANTAVSEGGALLDLRAGLEDLALGRTWVAPWVAVTNVLDRAYNASVVVNAFGGRYYEPGPPRALQVGASVRWRSDRR